MLCPAKKNLQCNLENHVNGLKHVKAVEAAQAKSTSSALSICKRGRPAAARRGLQGNYSSLHAFFKLVRRGGEFGSSSDASGQCSSIFSLLCWRYWGKAALYSNHVYDVKGLVNNPHLEGNWYPESATKAGFNVGDELFDISGSFRHVKCLRVSVSGEAFTNFTCSFCARIPKEDDFRKRYFRDSKALEKRGTCGPACSRRLNYLSI
jgi:hypothetical protein